MKHIGSFASSQWGQVDVFLANYVSMRVGTRPYPGPLAVRLMLANGEPLASLSVNLYRPEASRDSTELPADCFFVKNYAENELLAPQALASGLFLERPDLGVGHSGYVTLPVWQVKP